MATVTDPPAPPRIAVEARHWLILSAAIIVSIGLRLLVNTRFDAPTILTDELTYSQLARDIAADDFSLRNGYGVVYPLLMAPSWAFADWGTSAYTLMKATNAVVISATAIPVFLWSRRLMRPGFALMAAALTLLMPSMAYSGHVMTENAFMLAVVVVGWAMAAALERPTLLRQALVVAVVLLAFGTRAQAVVLVAALPLVVILGAIVEERAAGRFAWGGAARRLLPWWPTGLLAGAGVLALVARSLITGGRWSELLQAYGATASGQYTPEKVLRYFLWHLGEAAFALGVVPVAALGVLVGLLVVNRSRTTAERTYVTTTVVLCAAIILQVAIFTSYWSERGSERNMFCVFPLVLIGLALWMDRDLPRPRRIAGVAAACAGVVVFSVPFAYLYARSPSTETWAVVLPELLTRRLPGGVDDVQILIAVGVAVALLAFGIVGRRVAIIAVPVLLVGYFAVSTAAAVHAASKVSRDYRNAPSIGRDADWLDRALPAGSDVAFVTGSNLGPDTDRVIGWQTGFFNRTPLPWLGWGSEIVADPVTGMVTAPGGTPASLPEYVITPASARFAGDLIADRGAFLLQRPSAPYRLDLSTAGIYADGWAGPAATIDVFAGDGPGVMRIDVSRADNPFPAPASAVTIRSGALARAADGTVGISAEADAVSGSVDTATAATFEIRVPAPPYRVEVSFDPSFSPSEFGSPDTRQIGGRLTAGFGDFRIGYVP